VEVKLKKIGRKNSKYKRIKYNQSYNSNR